MDSLIRDGFAVISGAVPTDAVGPLADAYDRAVLEADRCDVRHGSTTTRVDDLVNRGPEFDPLYVYPPLLEACRSILGTDIKLSTMLARTLRPATPPQELHQDFPRDGRGWTMVGFIFMIDEFRAENGATCFLPGSHLSGRMADVRPVPACGRPGSVLIYNGAVWHGHGSNETPLPRRSIQGAFLRRDLKSGFDLPGRMRPETLARIGPAARSLILGDDSKRQ